MDSVKPCYILQFVALNSANHRHFNNESFSNLNLSSSVWLVDVVHIDNGHLRECWRGLKLWEPEFAHPSIRSLERILRTANHCGFILSVRIPHLVPRQCLALSAWCS